MEDTSVESTNDTPSTVNWSEILAGGSDPSSIDWKKITDWLTGQLKTPAGAITGVAGLGTLLGGWNKPATPPGWRGTVGENKYTASRAGPPITFVPRTSYGEAPRVAAYNDLVYTPRGAAAPAPAPPPAPAPAPASDIYIDSTGAAAGGLMQLARGGRARRAPPPRYLRGETDGMADKLPSSIDGRQPAKLSHGEFVIPADVVSHLGNGNSDAGAKVLYKMMDRVRQARTGTKQQGKRINPEKFTPGGIASGYAGGGAVAFQTGGTTGTTTTTATAPVTRESNLSSWVGPYIADFMDKGQALAGTGYTPYMGALTAGIAPLQKQAFDTLGKPTFGSETFSATGAYAPPTATGAPGAGGSTGIAAQYMNPYLQSVLTPQLDELRRQNEISQQGLQSKFAQAGALGGARDVIARTEGLRNLASQQANIVGQAYSSAFDRAQQQFNTEQQQRLQNLSAQLGAGGIQQAAEQKAIDAERGVFEEARMWPYKQLQFQQSLIQGLPVGTSTQSSQLSPFQQAGQIGGGLMDLYNVISKIPGFGGK